jgi:tRNA-dihydrouridine synthase
VIARVAAAVRIPVIGNGDLTGARDVARRSATGVRGFMLGRAAMSSPWIFREIRHWQEAGEFLAPPSLEEQWGHICRHCRLVVEREGSERHAMAMLRSRLMAYSRGMPDAKGLRGRFSHIASLMELEEIAAENLHDAGANEPSHLLAEPAGSL